MTIKHVITDGDGNGLNAHVHKRNGDKGLVCFTEELKEKETLFSFAINPDIGFEMAIDGTFGGIPINVHNGTDNAYWTGSQITGSKITFNDPFSDGSEWTANSIESNKSALGDIWQFAKGSDQDLSSHIAISMDIYILSGWSIGNSVSIYGFDVGVGQVGDAVLLEDYFNETAFGENQAISIPLLDMGLSARTVDSFRFEIANKIGAGPVFYVDNIKIEETSGAKEFTVVAPVETKYYINQFKFTYIDGYVPVLTDSTMPKLPYNTILTVPKLTVGIGFKRIKKGVSLFNASVACLADSTRGGSVLENVYSDGTNTHVTVSTKFEAPVLLDSREEDSLVVTINDDLSGLISFTAVALGYTTKL